MGGVAGEMRDLNERVIVTTYSRLAACGSRMRFRAGELDDHVYQMLLPAFVDGDQFWNAFHRSMLFVAEDEAGKAFGAVLLSVTADALFVEGLGGAPGMIEVTLAWVRDVARTMRISRVRATTRFPSVAAVLLRKGARLDGAYLSVEV